jgi:iduronate 2-sulfatase
MILSRKLSRSLLALLATPALATVGFVLGAGPNAPRAEPANGTPGLNVVLLVVDGLGTPDSYARDVKTPNLDRLAARGRRFDRAYSQYPEGGPSRASLLSGWRPETTLVWRDRDSLRAHGRSLVPLQKHFRVNGYFVARVGLVYGGGKREGEMAWDLDTSPPDTASDPDWIAKRVAAILAEKAPDRLFLAASLERPPGGTPAKYTALHPPAGVALPADAALRPQPLPAIAIPGRPDRTGRPGGSERPPAASEEALRQERAAYDAHVAWVDAQVGILLEAMDRLKLWDRTAVGLVGDSAPYLGGHGAFPRGDVLFEETLRAPLVIAAPRVARPGTPSTQLVELVDLYPTLAELAGLPPVTVAEGTSLTPILADPERPLKTAAFSVLRRVAGQIGRSVRTDRYRYTEWPDGSEELYDHQRDPGEHTNLAGSEQAKTVAELKRLLATPDQPPPAPPPASTRPRGAKKPNVLLIVADDMSARLGCYGDDVSTPHMDRLARTGRRFDRAYCQVAICSPSRTSFMTGRRPERLGIWDNLEPPKPRLEGAVPMQEHFKAHGYFTARVGKVFHQSFDTGFAWDLAEHAPRSAEQEHEEGDGEAPPASRQTRRTEADMSSWSVPTDRPDEQEPDGQRARRVAQLIEERQAGPFFIALGLAKPHLRWVAPRKYFDLYPPEKIRLADVPGDDWRDIPEIAVEHDALAHPGLFLRGPLDTQDRRREGLAGYSAAVSFVDAQLGVVFETLDRLKLWDDTIVVVTSDHGFQLGEHGGLWRKDTLFEESLRVPLLIWAPGLALPGVPTSSLAELVDLYPTLTDLAGLARPKDLDGTSLVPVLQDPSRAVKTAAFSAARRRPPQLGWSVRTDRYRYTEWPDGSRELYDHQGDPGERKNLAPLPAQGPTLADLRRVLHQGWKAAIARRP